MLRRLLSSFVDKRSFLLPYDNKIVSLRNKDLILTDSNRLRIFDIGSSQIRDIMNFKPKDVFHKDDDVFITNSESDIYHYNFMTDKVTKYDCLKGLNIKSIVSDDKDMYVHTETTIKSRTDRSIYNICFNTNLSWLRYITYDDIEFMNLDNRYRESRIILTDRYGAISVLHKSGNVYNKYIPSDSFIGVTGVQLVDKYLFLIFGFEFDKTGKEYIKMIDLETGITKDINYYFDVFRRINLSDIISFHIDNKKLYIACIRHIWSYDLDTDKLEHVYRTETNSDVILTKVNFDNCMYFVEANYRNKEKHKMNYVMLSLR